MQGGYGGSTSQGGQASAGGYAMPQGFREAGTKNYNAYQSTVYEPFTSSTPSMISNRRNTSSDNYVGDGYDDDFTWGGDGEDAELENPGQGPTGSPVGEPFVLLFFAVVAAMVIAWRKKEPTPVLPQGKK